MRRKTYVLVAPSSQHFKGGVAQFSSRLAAELARFGDVLHISWLNLYPSLFVSRSIKDQTAALSERCCGEAELVRTLSCLKPGTWAAAAEMIAQRRPEKVFFSWVHPFHAPVYRYMMARLRKESGSERVLICHNVLPHEWFPGARTAVRSCLNLADRVVVHAAAAGVEAGRLLSGGQRIVQSFLPLHDFFPTAAGNKDEWRRGALLHLLFLGTLRKYKGVDVLLRALPLVLRRFDDIRVTIAGEDFFTGKLTGVLTGGAAPDIPHLISQLGLEKYVSLKKGYLEDSEVGRLVAEADALVCPYLRISQSGIALLAFAYGKPVIASAVGGLAEIVQHGVNGYLTEPNSPERLAEAILSFVDHPISREAVSSMSRRYCWEDYVRTLLEPAA